MHKSKNYDMATEVAMDKLMPKPIQITISMQGGGGLRGLGERPISSVYGRPIPRTIYRQYGGGPVIRRFMGGYSDVDAGVVGTDDEVTGISDIGGEPIPEEQRGGFGYTQEDVLRMQPNLIDDPTLTPTPNRPEDLATSPEGSSIRQGTKGWTTRGLLNYFGVPFHPEDRTSLTDYAGNALGFLGVPVKPEYSYKQADMLAPIPGRDQKTLTALDLGTYTEDQRGGFGYTEKDVDRISGVPSYRPGHGGRQERIDLIRELGLYPGQADKMQDALRERENAISESKRQSKLPDKMRHGFRTSKSLFGKPKAIPLSQQPRSIKNLPVGFAQGGGLSSIKKSMNINGQPHKLAWIRPDEASALKAMGGSGKKVEGIPAYFYDFYGEEGTGGGGDPQAGVDWASDVVTYTDMTQDPGARGDIVEDFTTTTTDQRGGFDAANLWANEREEEQKGGWGYTEKDVERMQASPTPRYDGGDNDYQQAKAKVQAREKWQNPYWNALKESGLSNDEADARLAGMGMSGLAKMEKAYKEGYSFGGPMGTMGGIGRDQAEVYAKKLKKILEEDKEIEEYNIDEDESGMGLTGTGVSEEEIEEKGLGGIWESIKQTIGTFPAGKEPQFTTTALIEDAVQKVGGKYEAVNRDPSLIKGIINFLTPSVGHLLKAIVGGKSIGTITKRGQTFDVLEDGSVVPIEFAPSNINEGPDPEPIRRRRRGPPPVAQPSTLEPEAPAKGTMAELLARRGPAATRAEGLASLREGVLPQIYTQKQIEDFNLA